MKLAYIGIPFTAHVCVATMQAAAFHALDFSRPDARGAVVDPRSNTVAGHNFNDLWCACLEGHKCPTGEEFSYFCLLHSDVTPLTPYFLDVLIDELETASADVIHAPCLIKDDRALTSTAVGNLDDDWDWHRKISLAELFRLPETFGLTDVLNLWEADEEGCLGRTFAMRRVFLAPNTGCMVCKIGDWCWRFPGFEQKSRIVSLADGRGGVKKDSKWRPLRRAELASEDWRFGRWCAQNDLKVVGTRKVITSHVGQYPWATVAANGHEAYRLARDDFFFKVQECPRAVP